MQQLENQIVECLREDHPQSVRFVFYRMTDPTLPVPVGKDDAGYGRVQRAVLSLRERGRVPWGWVADLTRRGYHVDAYDGAGDFVRAYASLYRYDMWTNVDDLVEVWCESRSVAAVIQGECNALGVSLYPCGGFASRSFLWQAARSWIESGKEDLIIYYVGDYDPAGMLIPEKVEEALRGFNEQSSGWEGRDLSLYRLAVNEDQIDAMNLPEKPRKAGDRRRLDVQRTVEVEAIQARVLRGMVRRAVENHLPEQALHVAREAEKSEREGLRRMAEWLDQEVFEEPDDDPYDPTDESY